MRAPLFPFRFGKQSGELARHVRVSRQFTDGRLPWLELPAFDIGLGAMIEYKLLLRKGGDKICRGFELQRKDLYVESVIVFAEQRYSRPEFFIVQKIVGFGLHDMPYAGD